MSRRDARELVFKLVFEYTFNEEKREDLVEEYTSGIDADDKAYVCEAYFGVIAHYDELKLAIKENIEKFDYDRLFKVDLALLLLAIYEIKFMEDIPFKVSTNEVLNLAEKYSTSKSVKYINGVLAKFVR